MASVFIEFTRNLMVRQPFKSCRIDFFSARNAVFKPKNFRTKMMFIPMFIERITSISGNTIFLCMRYV